MSSLKSFSLSSVDARTKSDFRHAEKWAEDSVFGGRATFLPERQPAQLEIKRVSEADAGMFRCRVDFQLAQTRNSKVNLTIIGKFLFKLPQTILPI